MPHVLKLVLRTRQINKAPSSKNQVTSSSSTSVPIHLQKAQKFRKKSIRPSKAQPTTLGPDWDEKIHSTKNQNRTYYCSPVRKISFKLLKDAIEFSGLMGEYNGDEYKAWEEYTRIRKEQKVSRRVVCANAVSTSVSFGAPIKNTEDYLKSCGWKRYRNKNVKSKRYLWLSPTYKIAFLWPKSACEFQELRKLRDYDEEKAWYDFLTKTTAKISDFIKGGQKEAERLIESKKRIVVVCQRQAVKEKVADVINENGPTRAIQGKTRVLPSRQCKRPINYDEATENEIHGKAEIDSRTTIQHREKKRRTVYDQLEVAVHPKCITRATTPHRKAKRTTVYDQLEVAVHPRCITRATIPHRKKKRRTVYDQLEIAVHPRCIIDQPDSETRENTNTCETRHQQPERRVKRSSSNNNEGSSRKANKYEKLTGKKRANKVKSELTSHVTEHSAITTWSQSKKFKIAKITPVKYPEKQRTDWRFIDAFYKLKGPGE